MTTPANPPRYAIGIGNNLLHAVRDARTDDDRSVRYARAECASMVTIAWEWGSFRRGNARLAGHQLCATCAWTVAFAEGTVEGELTALGPTAAEATVWQRLPGTGAFVDTCRAILAARASDRGDDEGSPSWAHLLGHLCAHRPAVLVREDCAERGCDHDDEAGCYADSSTVACPSCSVLAGSWCGEWEGQYVVAVPAPCSVVAAIAAEYGTGGAR